MRQLHLIVLIALAISVGSSPAAPVSQLTLDGKNVGSITVDRNDPLNVTTGGQPAKGANFLAHFDLTGEFDEQDCCDRNSLRWLQFVKTSKPQPGFTRTSFIDPQAGRQIGNNITSDDQPFYDLTYNSAANAASNINRRGNGSGRFAKDQPFNLVSQAPFTFEADLLLVCIHEMRMAILGGIHWGYTIAADGSVTPATPTGVGDNAALRTTLNDNLKLDYAGFSFVSERELCIPLPPAVYAMMLTVPLVLASVRKMKRQSSDASLR